jgi:hypothetical protein
LKRSEFWMKETKETRRMSSVGLLKKWMFEENVSVMWKWKKDSVSDNRKRSLPKWMFDLPSKTQEKPKERRSCWTVLKRGPISKDLFDFPLESSLEKSPKSALREDGFPSQTPKDWTDSIKNGDKNPLLGESHPDRPPPKRCWKVSDLHFPPPFPETKNAAIRLREGFERLTKVV